MGLATKRRYFDRDFDEMGEDPDQILRRRRS